MGGFPFVYRGTAYHWDENGLADITQRPEEIEQREMIASMVRGWSISRNRTTDLPGSCIS